MTFKKKMLILGCLAVVAAAGVGTSVAFILNDATEASTDTLTADSGIVISWDEESTLASIDTLTPGTSVEQTLIVDWATSESVTTGTIKTTFTLNTSSKDLTVRIGLTSFAESGAEALATLDWTDVTSYTAEIDLEEASNNSETYYVQYVYTGESEEAPKGTLYVSATYEAANND